MNGYDIGINIPHGPPSINHHSIEPGSQTHPDSTDSYVTYLESDDSMQGSP